MKHEIVKAANQASIYSSNDSFEHAVRIAKMLSSSDMVPAQYKGNIANTLVAMEMANRIGVSTLMVMQNLSMIEGRPGWSSPYVIGSINTCGKFAPLRFDIQHIGPKNVAADIWEGPKGQRTKKTVQITINDAQCIAWSVPAGVHVPAEVCTLANAKAARLPVIEGAPVTIEMAVAEGWYTKNGSKWRTMPELMLRYRAATFFGRLHCPEVLFGMPTADEVIDISPTVVPQPQVSPSVNQDGQNINNAKGGDSEVLAEINSALQNAIHDETREQNDGELI